MSIDKRETGRHRHKHKAFWWSRQTQRLTGIAGPGFSFKYTEKFKHRSVLFWCSTVQRSWQPGPHGNKRCWDKRISLMSDNNSVSYKCQTTLAGISAEQNFSQTSRDIVCKRDNKNYGRMTSCLHIFHSTLCSCGTRSRILTCADPQTPILLHKQRRHRDLQLGPLTSYPPNFRRVRKFSL